MMESSNILPIVTRDGSVTLYNPQLDVTYRSKFGASSESEHVFLQGTQLRDLKTTTWRVGELGFGAARNFCHTAIAAHQHSVQLEYHSLDCAPVPAALLPDCGWPTQIAREALEKAQEKGLSPIKVEHESIKLFLYPCRWQDVDFPVKVDALFHDPFGPRTNPESWTVEAFEWSRRQLTHEGRLATYSAASSVKKALKSAGFQIITRKGLPPKREVLVGIPYELESRTCLK